MPVSRTTRSSSKSTALVTLFDWENCLISPELAAFGKELENVVNVTAATMDKEALVELLLNMSQKFTNAVSKETVSITKTVDADKIKDNARVQNRAENAKSAATAKGGSEEDINSAVAEAVAKETKLIAERARSTAEKLEAEAKKAKEAAAASEAMRLASEVEFAKQLEIKKAAHEAELAKQVAQIQGTRARQINAREKAAKKDSLKVSAEEEVQSGEEPRKSKKRKTRQDKKEDFIALGNTAERWEEEEATRKSDAKDNAAKKAKAKYLPEIQLELQETKEGLEKALDFRQEVELKNQKCLDEKKTAELCLAETNTRNERLVALCKAKGASDDEIKLAMLGERW